MNVILKSLLQNVYRIIFWNTNIWDNNSASTPGWLDNVLLYQHAMPKWVEQVGFAHHLLID